MIESLTPQRLMAGLLAATLLASLITLGVSAVLRAAFRSRLRRLMQMKVPPPRASGPPAPAPAPLPAAAALPPAAPRDISAGLRALDAERAGTRAAWAIVAGGLGFALVFVLAMLLAAASYRTTGRLLLVLWVVSWPIVPALWLALPLRLRSQVALAALPIGLWSLVAVALAATERSVDGALDTVAPLQALVVWLVVNLPPTLMWVVFNGRRWGAVAPLVLGLASAVGAGALTLWMGLSVSPAGRQVLLPWAATIQRSPDAVLGLALGALALAGLVVGWLFMRRARRAYRAKQANDRSLTLDALWLLFAVWYAALLGLGGARWLLAGPLALCVWWLITRLTQPSTSGPASVSLVFLQPVAPGAGDDSLFERISRRWRYLAPIDRLCGPDVAERDAAPHLFVDYLSRRLRAQLVTDAASLAQRLQARDRVPDSDGRHRINTFLCQPGCEGLALSALMRGPAIVLVDVRGLAAGSAEGAAAFRLLVDHVPLARCVLAVDDSTDRYRLRTELTAAWRAMAPASPNRDRTLDDVPLHDLAHDDVALRGLMARLCAATH